MYVNRLLELDDKIRQKHARDYDTNRQAPLEKEKPVVDGFLAWPLVIGRKGWLFSDTQAGAEASAVIYTMVENAKANGVNIYQNLKLLLEKWPNDRMPDEKMEKLAP